MRRYLETREAGNERWRRRNIRRECNGNMNGGGGLKRQCLFHDGDWCTTSPTRFSSTFDGTIDLSLPSSYKNCSCFNWFFRAAFSRVVWRRLDSSKSHDLAKIHWRPLSAAAFSLSSFREGNYSSFSRGITLRGNYWNFFSDHIIYHLRDVEVPKCKSSFWEK